jgi:hypothetical protein
MSPKYVILTAGMTVQYWRNKGGWASAIIVSVGRKWVRARTWDGRIRRLHIDDLHLPGPISPGKSPLHP